MYYIYIMGKTQGINNYRLYHWRLVEYTDNDKSNVLYDRKYRTVNDIIKDYPELDRTKIYMMSNNLYKMKKQNCEKYLRFNVFKINEPITVEINGITYNFSNKKSHNNIEEDA